VIGERFREVSRDRRAAAAVRDLADGRVVTFGDLARDVDALQQTFAQIGVGRGMCVVSLVGNRPVFFSLVVACMEFGTSLLPLGEATDAEAVSLIERAGAALVVSARTLPIRDGTAAATCAGVRIVRRRAAAPGYGERVVLKLTSGSTDLPKAAIAEELHLINDGRHIIEAMGIRPDDVNLACIPLSHSYGLGNLVMPLLWQGTPVAMRPDFTPAHLANDVMVGGATVFAGVPFMFEQLRTLPQLDRLPASLRLLITAGARIDPRTVGWFRERLDRKIHSFYGSSETGGICYDDSDDVADPLHVGRAMPETDVTIVADDEGQRGRVFVTGNAVCGGYANRGPADQSPFRDGGFLTGDLGYLDEHGRLLLTGRASELVNVAGRKVDPAEVERTLLGLPGVSDARVLGMACDRRGQQVVAFVVRTDPGLTPIAIRQRCAATLSTYKIPRRFVFLDQLPVDARGKTDRRALQALALLEAAPNE